MGGKTINVYGFPLDIGADDVKEFLENYTGKGTIFALKFRHPKVMKPNSKAFAIVQFEKREDAATIIDIAERLRQNFTYHSRSFLKVRYVDRDIVPKPRKTLFVLEETTLHIGCLMSKHKLGVLWKCSMVNVHFGFSMKKISFFLSHRNKPYKLDLSYESIWEIKLHSHPFQSSKFLVFQVVAAPRLYEMASQSASTIFDNLILEYYKEIQEDQWIRTTDFTPSCSIGQSFALCLQLQRNTKLPNFKMYFSYYEEVTDHFNLEDALSYSQNLDLVPIVQPQGGIEIPFKILFKVNHMVQNGTIMGPTLDTKFFESVNPRKHPIGYIERALEKMSHSQVSIFNPAEWLNEQYLKYNKLSTQPPSLALSDPGLVYTHRVQITPTKIYFYGPEINVSNRVLRHYSNDIDNFIRVSFVDEDCGKMFSTDLVARLSNEKHTKVYWRTLDALRNGITLGNKKFDFLAFSSSQLRENSAWMFASRKGLTASDIRKWMGDFNKIRNVAKYAARLGQSFSSSTETLTVEDYEVEKIDDVKRNGYCFSDGIGKISPDFAIRVAIKCGLKSLTPSAFQIRYGGYKGVVAVDPTSTRKLSLRGSMSKFDSRNNKLDVLAYSRYQPCYLNRQIITLLSTLGVKDRVFEEKQAEVVDQLDEILSEPGRALEVVELMFPSEMTNIMKEMLLCGYKPNEEPFLSMLLQTFRAAKLFELRTKSRIFVPQGRSMIGCLDETGILDYGQVFVQVSRYASDLFNSGSILYKHSACESDNNKAVITGKVVVAKNPCLHPGDVRILMAVDVPSLRHMVDCVVFPQRGRRPHPNECSGSDLDGDIYFVSWDQSLIPARQVSPMEYAAAPAENLDHDVTIEEIHEYFTNYIVNDSLGIIANAHTVFADKEPLKAESEPCLELAKLFSIAVDFPKTGIPAEIPPQLYVKEFPDFMEKPDKSSYESKGVVGKLFRAVKDHYINPSYLKGFTKEISKKSYDQDMEVEGFMDHVTDAFNHKEQYDFTLGCLMDQYGIKTEAEILSGCVMKSKSFNKYKDGEAIGRAIRSLRKQARGWFNEGSELADDFDLDAKASAWYYVTYHHSHYKCTNEEYNWPHFLSFAWCVYDRLVIIKKNKVHRRKMEAFGLSSMSRRFDNVQI